MYAIPSLRTVLSTPPRVVLLGRFSPEVRQYLARVEDADGARLEAPVISVMAALASYRIPLGGAAVFMAGARTLAGALVPMVGEAPTAFNFVGGDYSRSLGLVGNGSTKYLSSNRNNNAEAQGSQHLAIYRTSGVLSRTQVLIGTDGGSVTGSSIMLCFENRIQRRSQSSVVQASTVGVNPIGLTGINRNAIFNYVTRINGANEASSEPSQTPRNEVIHIFAGAGNALSTDRLSYYSIGPSIDLAAMDTATTAAMNGLAALGI